MPGLTPPIISALTAGVLLIFQIFLLLLVVLSRGSNRQSLGSGSSPGLERAVRRHGNLAENAAIFIAAFALFEMLGGNRENLEVMCAIFLVGRLSHAIGLSMTRTVNPFRIAGIVATVGVGVTLGLRLISLALPLAQPLLPH